MARFIFKENVLLGDPLSKMSKDVFSDCHLFHLYNITMCMRTYLYRMNVWHVHDSTFNFSFLLSRFKIGVSLALYHYNNV